MSDLHDTVFRAGMWKYLTDRSKEQFTLAKQELARMPFGDTVSGRHGDRILWKAFWTSGSEKIAVTDPAALLEWVREHHPTEIVVTETVNQAYMKTLKVVEGKVVDGIGEPVAGVKVETGSPYITVKSQPDITGVVAELLSSGQVVLRELEAIEGGA